VELGINGKGSGPNGEITAANVYEVFKGVTIDKVKSRRTRMDEYNVPILNTGAVPGLWDFHMKDPAGPTFSEKIEDFNEKIRTFKNALKTTGSTRAAFLAMLNGEYKNAMGNFWGNAEIFARKIKDSSMLQRRVRRKGIFTPHRAHFWHANKTVQNLNTHFCYLLNLRSRNI
jgi:hypothetical protein